MALPLLMAGRVDAAEIPASIRRAYLAGSADVRLPTDPATIPLRGTDWYGHDRSPYLKVFVNGHGPYTFLFDTGAVVTIVSSQVARETGAAIVSRVPGHHAVARFRELRASGIVMRDYYAIVADGNDVDGILGFNAFGANFLTFDLRGRTLRVSSRPVALPRAVWLPYGFEKRLPTITVRIDGRRLPTLIDSGDDAYAWEGTSDDLRGLLFDSPPVQSAVVYNGETGATRTRITSIDGTLELGNFYARRPAVAINDSLPLPDIGVDVIEQFVVEFDRIHRRVAFAPLFAGREFTVPGERTCGVYVSFRQPTRLVRDVLPGSAPARSGVRVGDTVVSIDGRDAQHVNYRQWDELLRGSKTVTLVWERDGRRFSATFPVVELR